MIVSLSRRPSPLGEKNVSRRMTSITGGLDFSRLATRKAPMVAASRTANATAASRVGPAPVCAIYGVWSAPTTTTTSAPGASCAAASTIGWRSEMSSSLPISIACVRFSEPL